MGEFRVSMRPDGPAAMLVGINERSERLYGFKPGIDAKPDLAADREVWPEASGCDDFVLLKGHLI